MFIFLFLTYAIPLLGSSHVADGFHNQDPAQNVATEPADSTVAPPAKEPQQSNKPKPFLAYSLTPDQRGTGAKRTKKTNINHQPKQEKPEESDHPSSTGTNFKITKDKNGKVTGVET